MMMSGPVLTPMFSPAGGTSSLVAASPGFYPAHSPLSLGSYTSSSSLESLQPLSSISPALNSMAWPNNTSSNPATSASLLSSTNLNLSLPPAQSPIFGRRSSPRFAHKNLAAESPLHHYFGSPPNNSIRLGAQSGPSTFFLSPSALKLEPIQPMQPMSLSEISLPHPPVSSFSNELSSAPPAASAFLPSSTVAASVTASASSSVSTAAPSSLSPAMGSSDSSSEESPMHSGKSALNSSGSGTSCHQCKSRRTTENLTACGNQFSRRHKASKASCRKKFCESCLLKFYQERPPKIYPWICPACRGKCCCAACRRKDENKSNNMNNNSSGDSNINIKNAAEIERAKLANLPLPNLLALGYVYFGEQLDTMMSAGNTAAHYQH